MSPSDESVMDALSLVMSAFDPSKAGICLSSLESLKKHRLQHVNWHLSTSDYLHDCYSGMIALLFDQFAFPIMFKYIFNYIGSAFIFPSWTLVLLAASVQCMMTLCVIVLVQLTSQSQISLLLIVIKGSVCSGGVLDVHRKVQVINIYVYHVPGVYVHLLSPHCILHLTDSHGGHALNMYVLGMELSLMLA